MSQKIVKLAFWLIPVVCLSLCPIALMAQKSPHTQTVTGCLQKGEVSGEFSIKGEDGKT